MSDKFLLRQQTTAIGGPTYAMAEFMREERGDGYWVGVWLPAYKAWLGQQVGPFETQTEADRALEDLKQTALSLGSVDVPLGLAN